MRSPQRGPRDDALLTRFAAIGSSRSVVELGALLDAREARPGRPTVDPAEDRDLLAVDADVVLRADVGPARPGAHGQQRQHEQGHDRPYAAVPRRGRLDLRRGGRVRAAGARRALGGPGAGGGGVGDALRRRLRRLGRGARDDGRGLRCPCPRRRRRRSP
jgi:hypothetical protein